MEREKEMEEMEIEEKRLKRALLVFMQFGLDPWKNIKMRKRLLEFSQENIQRIFKFAKEEYNENKKREEMRWEEKRKEMIEDMKRREK